MSRCREDPGRLVTIPMNITAPINRLPIFKSTQKQNFFVSNSPMLLFVCFLEQIQFKVEKKFLTMDYVC